MTITENIDTTTRQRTVGITLSIDEAKKLYGLVLNGVIWDATPVGKFAHSLGMPLSEVTGINNYEDLGIRNFCNVNYNERIAK